MIAAIFSYTTITPPVSDKSIKISILAAISMGLGSGLVTWAGIYFASAMPFGANIDLLAQSLIVAAITALAIGTITFFAVKKFHAYPAPSGVKVNPESQPLSEQSSPTIEAKIQDKIIEILESVQLASSENIATVLAGAYLQLEANNQGEPSTANAALLRQLNNCLNIADPINRVKQLCQLCGLNEPNLNEYTHEPVANVLQPAVNLLPQAIALSLKNKINPQEILNIKANASAKKVKQAYTKKAAALKPKGKKAVIVKKAPRVKAEEKVSKPRRRSRKKNNEPKTRANTKKEILNIKANASAKKVGQAYTKKAPRVKAEEKVSKPSRRSRKKNNESKTRANTKKAKSHQGKKRIAIPN